MNYNYIAVNYMPLSNTPPDDYHTVLDYTYVSGFYVLREEYKKNGNSRLHGQQFKRITVLPQTAALLPVHQVRQ